MTISVTAKPAIIVAIITGLTAIVFVTQAFSAPEEADSKPIKDYVLSLHPNDFVSYTDPVYGFSVDLPKDFIVSSSPQDEGEVIVAEHPTFNLGFEVFVTPFDQEGPLTVDAIHQAVPSLIVDDPVETELEDGTPAVRFASDDPAIGRTRQIWFAHDGNLFQVVMYSDNLEWLDAWVRELPQDWRFTPQQTADQAL
jgi:hypothetical protein